MAKQLRVLLVSLLFALAINGGMGVLAQEIPPAEIVNDEGGVQQVIGTVPSSNPFNRDYYTRPIIMLEDQAGFVDRDLTYQFPPESQIIGDFIDNFYDLEDLEIDYSLSLPVQPQGSTRDVDNNDSKDTGVQIFTLAIWDNIYGDLTIERYDTYGYGGWSGADTSVIVSQNPETLYEYTGGRMLVWAPDDEQGFPAGFGEDGLLFTEDDPIVGLPSGWTMVDLDSDPFTFDRSNTVTINTYEVEDTIPDDFSDLSYTEAFAEVLAIGRTEYAYTELKNIDWDALEAEFMPRIQAAEDDEDTDAYLFAMNDFARSIPDGHVAFYSATSFTLLDAESALIAGGIGISLRELSDGRILVSFLVEDGPADEAGIVYGAEILALNGMPIDEAIEAVESVNAPYSLPSLERLDQIRFVTRFPLETEVEITYRNPGDDEDSTAVVTVSNEYDSVSFTRQFIYGQAVATALQPVSWSILPSGYGYITINTFSGEGEVIMDQVLDFIRVAKAIQVPGIIIDLRNNSGGYSGFYARTAGYFFNEEIEVGYTESYNRDIDAFFYDADIPGIILPYPDEANIWDGPVALLVNPACASACEAFAYLMTQNDRSAVVGQYPTNGIIGARYFDIALPDDTYLSLPTGRDIDMDGNPIIEGIGIQPTVLVPVTEDNMAITLDQQDIVLDAAIAHLDEVTAIPVTEAGAITVDEPAEGTLSVGERLAYTWTVAEAGTYDIIISDPSDSGDLDSYLRIYFDGTLVAENDDLLPGEVFTSGFEGVQVDEGDVVVVEVAGYADEVEGDFVLTISPVEAE